MMSVIVLIYQYNITLVSTGQSYYMKGMFYEEMENPALIHFLAVAMYFIFENNIPLTTPF